MKIKKLAILCLLLLTLIPLTASAQVSFRRAVGEKLNFEIKQGGSLTKEITVINIKDIPIDVSLYATDGTQTTTGSFTVLPRTSEQSNIGAWGEFEEDLIHLDGMEEKIVKYTFKIPPTITPGVYGGGLSAQPVPPKTSQKATGAIVSTRVVVPVFITIPGDKNTQYNWNDFSYTYDKEKHSFSLNLENTGNTIIQTKGSIQLEDLFGNITEIPLHDVTMLQGEPAHPEVHWYERPIFGIYTAKANLSFLELNIQLNKFEEFDAQSKELSFSIIPWTLIFGLLILIALIIVAVTIKKIMYKNFIKKCVQYQVQEGDTIKSISVANNLSWKKLAQINNLEEPYEIIKGQTLIVPPQKK